MKETKVHLDALKIEIIRGEQMAHISLNYPNVLIDGWVTWETIKKINSYMVLAERLLD